MQIIFTDNGLHQRLAPFTLTRPVAEIRTGILTFRESWQHLLDAQRVSYEVTFETEDYLHAKYPKPLQDIPSVSISGNIKPNSDLFKAVLDLKEGEALYANEEKIAQNGAQESIRKMYANPEEVVTVTRPWHLFQHNGEAISQDFELLTNNRKSGILSATNRAMNPENIFIEEGAKVEYAILNASTGPIYIGKNAEIMEGSIIRGPFTLGEGAVVKMAAKIYGPTTIGPFCKVGGEISNSLFQAYSNKGHDGFLGNSVIGEWCNLGADTNSSNLKNNYSNVKVYSFETGQMEKSDVLFCGVLMGDHSKTGINTMLNTATVIGVSANVFGGDFPPKYIPSFTWGGSKNEQRFILEKAFEVAQNMMARRKVDLTAEDKIILTHIYQNLA